jgi:hypothetical protein
MLVKISIDADDRFLCGKEIKGTVSAVLDENSNTLSILETNSDSDTDEEEVLNEGDPTARYNFLKLPNDSNGWNRLDCELTNNIIYYKNKPVISMEELDKMGKKIINNYVAFYITNIPNENNEPDIYVRDPMYFDDIPIINAWIMINFLE